MMSQLLLYTIIEFSYYQLIVIVLVYTREMQSILGRA